MNDDIIDLNTKEPVVAVARREGGEVYCDCRKVWLDVHDRTVKCRSCGKTLDPFQWMLSYAYADSSLIARLSNLQEEYKQRFARLEELKAEEQRVKSRIREAKNRLLDKMGV